MSQEPNKEWRFSCGCSCLLPGVGISNEQVYWSRNSECSRYGGYWLCAPCKRIRDKKYCKKHIKEREVRHKVWRDGKSKTGLLGRIKYLLTSAKAMAKRIGYLPPAVTPEEALDLWVEQKGLCKSCKREIDIMKKNGFCLDHNHITGVVRGFLCIPCNMAEGWMKDFTDEQFEYFVGFACEWRRRGL